jgi:hypothetical protein
MADSLASKAPELGLFGEQEAGSLGGLPICEGGGHLATGVRGPTCNIDGHDCRASIKMNS